MVNEMIARNEQELSEARKIAPKFYEVAAALSNERDESNRLRAQVEELQNALAIQKGSNERLKNRLRYLKAIETPSGKITQIRGTLGVAKFLREKKKIDVPQNLIDRMEQDLEKYKSVVKEIPEVELNDDDLIL